MFKKRESVKVFITLWMILIMFFLVGCGKDNKNDEIELQSKEGQSTEEKAPEMLENIESQLESLFRVLGGPSVSSEEDEKGGTNGLESSKESDKETEQIGTHQQGTTQHDADDENTQEQGNSKEGQENSASEKDTQSQDSEKQNTEEQDKWTEIDKIISSLHYQWNSYMPEAAKKGADTKMVDSFDNALNTLTTSAAQKNNKNVMAAANELYSHVADIYSLYKTKMSSEIKRMIYFDRNIILESENENWEAVKENTEKLERSWALFRNTLDENQKSISDKLDFSMYELNKVTSQSNKQLTSIKGKVILSNIKELIESYEKLK